MHKAKQKLRNICRWVYKIVFPPESPPMETTGIEKADAADLFPNLYEQPLTIGKLAWKWGDLPNERSLIFLCALARYGYSPIVEFGTFRGRMAYNLALNTNDRITTIDLGETEGRTIDCNANVEGHAYDVYKTGELFLDAPPTIRERIVQILGDSTKVDLSHLYGTIGLVIVDGGHSYEVCKSDSEKALHLVRKGGVVVWDDYNSYWPGVKKTLDELAKLVHLIYLPREGLVVYRCEKA
jgi:predicted O-methyltransferase YrrM